MQWLSVNYFENDNRTYLFRFQHGVNSRPVNVPGTSTALFITFVDLQCYDAVLLSDFLLHDS